MTNRKVVQRICKNALLLAVLCICGMFSIPLGENVKVSLQLLFVFIVCLLVDSWIDAIIITGCYLLLGLVAPIYAGFSSNISPTFGFVIGFVVASPAIYWLNRIPRLPSFLREIMACLVGTIVVYVCGVAFMMAYLSFDLPKTLMVAVVPYLPFDAAKIALAVLLVEALRRIPVVSERKEKE